MIKFHINLKRRSGSGFSLIEMIVSLFIFTIMMAGVGLTFVEILHLQRRGFGAQKVQENALHMFELMAREVRIAKIENQDTVGPCGAGAATSLDLDHPVNGLVTYSYDPSAKKVTRTQGGGTGDLTSSEVEVNSIRFCIRGSDPVDNEQVRIAVIVQMQNKTPRTEDVVLFDLQTTLTSRDIRTEYVD